MPNRRRNMGKTAPRRKGMIPADLLDQLREKDPELWERMRRMPVYVHQDDQLTIDLTKSNNTELVNALAAIP